MSGEFYSLLWKRSKRFMVRAERDLAEGDYDGACFNAEEALQLAVKAVFYKYFAEVPRIHGSRTLLARLASMLRESGKLSEAGLLSEFSRRYKEQLILLEDSYIMARYGNIEYGRLQAEDCVRVAREGLGVLREVERRLG